MYLKCYCELKMFIKSLCLLLVLALMAIVNGRPYGDYNGTSIDPGFGRYPNQGFVPDAGFGDGHGQGGLPSQDDFHYGSGGRLSNHRHGYQQYGY